MGEKPKKLKIRLKWAKNLSNQSRLKSVSESLMAAKGGEPGHGVIGTAICASARGVRRDYASPANSRAGLR